MTAWVAILFNGVLKPRGTHSYRTQSDVCLSVDNGPDTATPTSQAGPHHQVSLGKDHLMATSQGSGAPVRPEPPTPFPFPARTPCRPWCDHDGQFPTVHESTVVSLSILPELGVGDLLTARIAVDDDFVETPQVIIKHADTGLPISAQQVNAVADQLVAFAEQIRHLATRTGEAVAA